MAKINSLSLAISDKELAKQYRDGYTSKIFKTGIALTLIRIAFVSFEIAYSGRQNVATE